MKMTDINFKFWSVLTQFILIIFIISQFTSINIYAKNDTGVSSTSNKDIVEQVEEERILKLKKELSLTLPDTIDNPSYAITFVNPSPRKPVEVTIDGKVYSKIKSPFLLPNLTFGKHTLIFKFTNKDGLIRVLTTEVLVVPRPPKFDDTINSEFKEGDQISLSGTATPNSKVILIINSQKVYKIDTDLTGKWTFLLKELDPKDLHLLAFTVKNGIVSDNYSKLEIKFNSGSLNNSNLEEKTSAGDRILAWLNVVKDWIYNNLEALKITGFVISGFILVIIVVKIKKKLDNKRDEKTLAELLSKQISDTPDILEVIKDVKDSSININKLSKNMESKNVKHITVKSKSLRKNIKNKKQNYKGKKVKVNDKRDKSKLSKANKTKLTRSKSKGDHKVVKPILRLSFGKKNKDVDMGKSQSVKKSRTEEISTSKKSRKKILRRSKIDSVDNVKASKKVLSKEEFLKKFKKIDK